MDNLYHKNTGSVYLTYKSLEGGSIPKEYKCEFGYDVKDSIISSLITLTNMDFGFVGRPDIVVTRSDNAKSVLFVKVIDDTDDLNKCIECAKSTIDYFKEDNYKCVYTIVHTFINKDDKVQFRKVYHWYCDVNNTIKCAEHTFLINLSNIFSYLNSNGEDLKELVHRSLIELNKEKISNIESFIWSIADVLRGNFREADYSNVIIPMTILTRLDSILEDKSKDVTEMYNQIKDINMPQSDKDNALKQTAGCNYYNISGYDLSDVARQDSYDTFYDYIDGYSDNVKEILRKLDFFETISKLDDAYLISSVVDKFCEQKDAIKAMSQNEMGTIFENLVRKFSEKDNDGEHFTSPDIVKVCCDMLIDSDVSKLSTNNSTYTIYDQTMGTSQMLTVMNGFIKDLNSNNNVELYGQEINPKTWAVAAANELIKRDYTEDAFSSRLKLGNTLTDDKFPDEKFDYIISNPPFGVKWDMWADRLELDPRFYGIGYPAKSDGQLLFTLNGLYHLNNNGRMAIIHNGSPMFSGGHGSGEALIRQYLINNDYLEAIVKLPKDLFYNTGITTYIWVITKNKKEYRRGKVQLIDASNMFKPLRKSQGSRRNEITDEHRNLIFKALEEFKHDEIYDLNNQELESKIFDNNFFKGEPDNFGRYKWEIPFDKLFYKAEEQENSDTIKKRILKLNDKIRSGMVALFGTDMEDTAYEE